MEYIISTKAKINLTLNITSKRHDGYHNLVSLICFNEPSDKIKIYKSDDNQVDSYGKFASAVSGENIIYKCMKLIEKYGVKDKFKVTIEKNIPVGAGLGGGSGDAAAFLNYIIENYNLEIDVQDIAKLGADVPVCMYSKSCFISGVGEIIEPINLPEFYIATITPTEHNDTSKYFSYITPSDYVEEEKPQISSYKDLCDYINDNGNIFLKYAIDSSSKIAALYKYISSLNPDAFGMSGTGSTMFIIADSRKKIEEYILILQKRYPYYAIY